MGRLISWGEERDEKFFKNVCKREAKIKAKKRIVRRIVSQSREEEKKLHFRKGEVFRITCRHLSVLLKKPDNHRGDHD